MTSGVVALVLQANKTLTPAQVKTVLQKTAKQPGSSVPNNDYGYGRVDAKAALEYVLTGKVPVPTPTPTPTPGVSPTPTATPQPGAGSAVSLTAMFARYNNQYGQLSQFQVVPGTTVSQGIMMGNIGDSADSYTISVNGIPAGWYTIAGYNGEVLQPNAAAYITMGITPAAGAAGTYSFTVTATSNSASSIKATKSFTLNVGTGAVTPRPRRRRARSLPRRQRRQPRQCPENRSPGPRQRVMSTTRT